MRRRRARALRWVVRWSGFIATAILLVFLIPALRDYFRGDGKSSRSKTASISTQQVLPAVTESTTQTVPQPRPTTSTATPQPREVSTFTFTAARGESWLSIHSQSSSGPVLYEGILPRGESLRFKANRLWIRFGWASSLDVTLNGKLVTNIPIGTVNMEATSEGFRVSAGQ